MQAVSEDDRDEEIPTMKKTYRGSCHCGRVKFEADIDLSSQTFRCNCTYCMKVRTWFASVEPGDFRLLAGDSDLAEYQFGQKRIHHRFCRHCGTRPFGHADLEETGPFVAVALASLDDAEPAELAAAPITYFNGRADDFEHPPAETRYL
jgi:hypothetical protein